VLTTVACFSPSTRPKTIYQQHDSPLQGRSQGFESPRLHRITAQFKRNVTTRPHRSRYEGITEPLRPLATNSAAERWYPACDSPQNREAPPRPDPQASEIRYENRQVHGTRGHDYGRALQLAESALVTEPSGMNPEYVAAEYQATNSAYLQYDAFRWSSGSLLVAGSFVLLGLLANPEIHARSVFAGSIIVSLVMAIWLLSAEHYRLLFLFKIDRILELEEVMKAEQHRRFNPKRFPLLESYPTIRPKGHHLDAAMYTVVSLGGPLLAYSRGQLSICYSMPIAIVVAVLLFVWRQEHKFGPNRAKNHADNGIEAIKTDAPGATMQDKIG
jgi:hypothetical protein